MGREERKSREGTSRTDMRKLVILNVESDHKMQLRDL